ncbi:MAG TPA: sulfotransferase [Solirubrobacteraceae bacterium]|nr:sulfotransferase [Solirubrobacteraceae bacterium]
MRVIGVGLPRTGTLTQKLAFEMLGFAPCYHWVNLIADLDQVELWERALDGEDIWDDVFAGFDATVDWPGGYFYRELSRRYPDAKVVLSVRDAAGWEKSFSETIVEMCHGSSLMPLLSNARAEVDPRWKRYLALVDRMFWSGTAPFTGGTSAEALMEQAEAFNRNVRDAVPAERLLEWSVSEGWGPLCEFLGVDVPTEPLPHENDRETFIGRVTDGAINALHGWQQQRLAEQPA